MSFLLKKDVLDKRENKMLNSAGLLYGYIAGIPVEEEQLGVLCVHSYQCYMQNWKNEIQKIRENIADDIEIEFYFAIGESKKIKQLNRIVVSDIRKAYEKCENGMKEKQLDIYGNYFLNKLLETGIMEESVKFPRSSEMRSEEWTMVSFWFGESPEDKGYLLMDETAKIWLNTEKPFMLGKQIMIQSFSYQNLMRREVISVKYDSMESAWCLIMEGGRKVYLNQERNYYRDKLGSEITGQWEVTEVDEILHNPAWAFGKKYEPFELFEEWQSIFLFYMAMQEEVSDIETIKKDYFRFLKFMEENICEFYKASVLIDQSIFFRAMRKHIEQTKGRLQGEEEQYLSKDFLLLLNSRHLYIGYMLSFLKPIKYAPRLFEKTEFQKKLNKGKAQKLSYEKGVVWEEAAEYYISCICGLRVSARRKRTESGEIDISVVNISMDEELWKMGAFLLVECKNWEKRVDVSVIRQLANTAKIKGHHTILLFVFHGITEDAKELIDKEAMEGKYIICFDGEELEQLTDNQQCYDLLIRKYKEIENKSL